MLAKSISLIALLLTLNTASVAAGEDHWFFSPEAIADAHRYQRQFGARLHNPVDPSECYYGRDRFTAVYHGKSVALPCAFINATKRQLNQLLGSDAARYLFPLDVGEARLAIPADVYAGKYEGPNMEEILPQLLQEPTLVAIYRTQTHALTMKKSSDAAGKTIVIGYYDGRPNRSLPQGQPAPGFVELGTIYLMEHFLGELTIMSKQRVVTFDLSFESDKSVAPTTTIAVGTASR